MRRIWVSILAVAVVGASIASATLAEKVMFHQEGSNAHEITSTQSSGTAQAVR